ncbi:hypothetical protein RD792_014862 [Penstemon davidsonii]|uniref:Receptor-like serine/threonine-protein kinase n=1 Tax=Penstemon davidsonii TaxID=160366 RepID=A0ABR0CRL7_9LAMI|nr:hypothetical protein RD792_014862 [Penstemon davidsonii]
MHTNCPETGPTETINRIFAKSTFEVTGVGVATEVETAAARMEEADGEGGRNMFWMGKFVILLANIGKFLPRPGTPPQFKTMNTFVTAIFFLIFPLVSSLDTLKPGEMLNSSAYLVSAGRNFTLEFYTPENSKKSYLAIRHTMGTNYHPVWLANRDRPIYENSGILMISNTWKVMIEHSGADPIELYTAESGTNVTATLLDSGNFVVKEMNSNKVLWQSFDYPTDTLLPGMKLGVNHRTGRNWTLTSWFSPSNPASGAFSLEWDSIRRRLLVKRRGVIYWTSGDLKFYYEYGNLKIYAFDYIVPKPDPLNMNYVFKNVTNQDEEYFTYSLYADSFTFENRHFISGWTLNSQGNIFDTTRPLIAQVQLCYGYNTSGSSVYLGCELWQQPKCRNSHQKFSYRYGNFGDASYVYDDSSNLSQSDCRANCWNDCLCAGYTDAERGCLYWKGKNVKFLEDYYPLSRQLYALVPDTPKKSKYFTSGIFAILHMLMLSWWNNIIERTKKRKGLQELMVLEGYTETTEMKIDGSRGYDVIIFTHASILASTDNFSSINKLGEGGFGPVYKGRLPEGRDIAVKLLSRGSGQGLLEFKTELVLISKLQHRNLVKLLGFCIHGNEKMIIYDYMPNKSLDFFLFDPVKREQLNWETRFNIIEGIAQGLLYLHKYSRLLVIHRDLKAGNILLDEHMNPKISDFGLARIFKENVAEANTNNRAGTLGYMAPEYAFQGIFSVKSDIYSFGVLILEIVSGRRNNSFQHLEGPLTLVEFAWDMWKQSALLNLMDPILIDSCTEDQLRRCIQVGLLCVQNHANERPPIEDVISMLKNETSSLPVPKEPAFILRNNVVEKLQNSGPHKFSLNEVSYSEMGGR